MAWYLRRHQVRDFELTTTRAEGREAAELIWSFEGVPPGGTWFHPVLQTRQQIIGRVDPNRYVGPGSVQVGSLLPDRFQILGQGGCNSGLAGVLVNRVMGMEVSYTSSVGPGTLGPDALKL